MTAPDATIEARLAAADPSGPRELGSLLERLAALGLVVGARLDGRPIGTPALARLAVRGPVDDSRRVRDGSIFVALPGEHVDGRDFVARAAVAGAALAVVGDPVPDAAIAQLVVRDGRRTLAEAACWWYGDPSRELAVVGITGTDGKTTTSYLATAALEAAGIRTGMLGTAGLRIGGRDAVNAEHVTTPAAPDLQRALRAMRLAGDAAAVVETTSHGLALERVAGIAYDAAIITNVTHEHLEFHGTFEAYRAAKLSLFEQLASRRPAKPLEWPRLAIVNADDPSADLFEAVAREAGARVVRYGTDARAEVRATRVEEDARRLRVTFVAPSGERTLDLRLAGRFNVHNALAVVALGEGIGLDPAAVAAGLEGVAGVPGRMERVDAGQPFGVIVDYAHTPASLEHVLDLLAPVAAARGGGLIAVFGSAGERDRAKRPMMGRLAGERCRLVVVTDEDPRGEDRVAILDEIAAGAEAVGRRRGRDLLVIADRRAAIAAAIERARTGDVVVLAGKGHERTILTADGPVPWDERVAAVEALAAAGYVAAGHGAADSARERS
ncbi:MAG TPA: UDP-N-acetylmuramoyl-L-alanyl-D-glutamate--2,6-diaminopimelate ligase [Candidatus Limnocylindrales bacterium]|nr:UDP-N-acetylmuramoyl-L-alanyl-D-glutamate--2,6-diaminopimelate ligase [Candidatus Limnocylindrales bacterium]